VGELLHIACSLESICLNRRGAEARRRPQVQHVGPSDRRAGHNAWLLRGRRVVEKCGSGYAAGCGLFSIAGEIAVARTFRGWFVRGHGCLSLHFLGLFDGCWNLRAKIGAQNRHNGAQTEQMDLRQIAGKRGLKVSGIVESRELSFALQSRFSR
jgi:hypothetical protein